MVILKLSRSRSTAHKSDADKAQKQEELRDEQNDAAKEDSRSEEPEDYATYFFNKLAGTCIGAYGAAASGACLDGRDGPEVESEDGSVGNKAAETGVQNTDVQNPSQATPSVTVTKTGQQQHVRRHRLKLHQPRKQRRRKKPRSRRLVSMRRLRLHKLRRKPRRKPKKRQRLGSRRRRRLP